MLCIAYNCALLLQNKASCWRGWLLTGCWLGLALGTKTTALFFGLIPLTTWLLLVCGSRKGTDEYRGYKIKALLARGALTAAVAVLVFSVVSPYSLLNFSSFFDSMKYEGGVVAGTISVPYTLQFYRTVLYWFFMQNFPWYLGLPLALLGPLGSILWIAHTMWNLPRKEAGAVRLALPFLVFSAAYFLYVGGWHAKFIRYTVPLLPFFCLGGAYLGTVRIKNMRLAGLRNILIGIALGGTLIWAAAFCAIYLHPNTRTAAREWIYDHIPAGSNLVVEHYDYYLPGHVHGRAPQEYNYLTLENFSADSLEKLEETAKLLTQGDYLILSSRRLWGTIQRLPDLYPYTANYYRLLFSGGLGYSQIQEFTSYPRLGNIIINDDRAEETFQVFDHPQVLIFKNVKRYSESEFLRLLKPAD